MGTWGVLAFDNDDANDWAFGLEEVADLSLVGSALSDVEQTAGYLETPVASEALAACEVLARLLGHPGYHNAYTETADRWVSSHRLVPPDALLARAAAVIRRILADESELRDLWDDSKMATEWRSAVADLEARLRR